MVASTALVASKQPQRSNFDLIFETSNLEFIGINVHIASNSHFGGF